MRICIDIDGTLCETKSDNQEYSDVKPLPHAVECVRRLKEEGNTIILYTARNMKTCNNNVGKVIANIGMITLEWLSRNNIPFDEIYFGKPLADVYIDDKGLKYENDWKNIENEINNIKQENRKWV
tara:strand:+ start:666 stop:1040 length:375 start_codon:yes stop_codon:yes gene_type:complete